MMKTKLHMGSPMPKKPVSRRTERAAGGKSPEYNPKSAAKHLESQCHMAPPNGPMMQRDH